MEQSQVWLELGGCKLCAVLLSLWREVLKDLAVETRIYCSHFYRQQNQSTKCKRQYFRHFMKNAGVAGSQPLDVGDIQAGTAH